jgi:hypothetical protein
VLFAFGERGCGQHGWNDRDVPVQVGALPRRQHHLRSSWRQALESGDVEKVRMDLGRRTILPAAGVSQPRLHPPHYSRSW